MVIESPAYCLPCQAVAKLRLVAAGLGDSGNDSRSEMMSILTASGDPPPLLRSMRGERSLESLQYARLLLSRELTFPNSHDFPARFSQCPRNKAIAGDVLRKFRQPEFNSRLRRVTKLATRVPMPEALATSEFDTQTWDRSSVSRYAAATRLI